MADAQGVIRQIAAKCQLCEAPTLCGLPLCAGCVALVRKLREVGPDTAALALSALHFKWWAECDYCAMVRPYCHLTVKPMIEAKVLIELVCAECLGEQIPGEDDCGTPIFINTANYPGADSD